MQKILTYLLGALFICTQVSHARDASEFNFSHFKLGDHFVLTISAKPPFDAPCDVDKVDSDTMIVYYQGSSPCRGIRFPENTSIIMYTAAAANMKLDAMAWMGGPYFDTRSDFPLDLGDSEFQVNLELGNSIDSFTYRKGEMSAKAVRYAGNTFVFFVESKAVAYVVGNMPRDWSDKKWLFIAKSLYKLLRRGPQDTIEQKLQSFLNSFMPSLLITDFNKSVKGCIPFLHPVLLTWDEQDMSSDTKRYSFKKAHSNAFRYAVPVEITRIQKLNEPGTPSYVDRYRVFIDKKPDYRGFPAPVNIEHDKHSDQFKIYYLGSL